MKVLLFAAARQRVGAGSVELDVELPTTIAEVCAVLVERYPSLEGLVATSRWAVDQSFVDKGTTIRGNEEIALIPPVSGG